jgi:hypothetical protein
MSALGWLSEIFFGLSTKKQKHGDDLSKEVQKQSHKFQNNAMETNAALDELVREIKKRQE